MRHDPHGLRANIAAAALPAARDTAAIEQVNERRAQLRELAIGQALQRPVPRRPRIARLELELHAAVGRLGFDSERRERRVVSADEA